MTDKVDLPPSLTAGAVRSGGAGLDLLQIDIFPLTVASSIEAAEPYTSDGAHGRHFTWKAVMAGGVRGFDPERLLVAQLRAGLTVRGLARDLGVSPDVVFRWRRGSRRPYPRHLVALAEALGCKVSYLAPLPERPHLGHYRERRGLTQGEVGKELGVFSAAVSAVETGVVWPGDPDRWADVYGISVRTLRRSWKSASVQRTDTT